ncbi:MAG: MFS transporter [Pigmentiphaga sp.]
MITPEGRPAARGAEAAARQASGGQLAVILAGTMALQVVATAATLTVPVLTPVLPGASSVGIGWYLTLLYLGAMFGAAWGGQLIERIGPMRACQVALLLQLAGLALALPGDPGWRLAGALLCGLGYGPITPASSQILARQTPPDHVGLVFSIKQTGVPMGGLLTGLLLIPMASLAGWPAAIGLMLVLGAAGLLLCQGLHRRLGPATPRTAPNAAGPWYRPLANVWRQPPLRGVAIVSLCFSVVQLSLGGYLVLYLNQEIGLPLVQAGLVFSLAQAAGIIGRLGWGRLADTTGSPNTIQLVIAALMGVSSLLVGLASADWWLWLLILSAVLFGATAIGWNGLFLAEVARLAPVGAVASTTGAVLTYTYVGVVIGPVLFSQLGELAGSLGTAFVVLALAPATAILVLWRQRRRARLR